MFLFIYISFSFLFISWYDFMEPHFFFFFLTHLVFSSFQLSSYHIFPIIFSPTVNVNRILYTFNISFFLFIFLPQISSHYREAIGGQWCVWRPAYSRVHKEDPSCSFTHMTPSCWGRYTPVLPAGVIDRCEAQVSHTCPGNLKSVEV